MKMFFTKRKISVYLIILVSMVLVGISIALLFPDVFPSSRHSGKRIENGNSLKAQQLIRLADSLKDYDINSAIKKALEAEKIVTRHGLDSLVPKVYVTQGDLFSYKSEYPQALQKFLAAETDYEQLQSQNIESSILKRDYAVCLNKISEVYFHLNRLDKALDYIEASLNIYKELNDPLQIAKATSNLGGIYFKNEMYEEALATYLEVLEYYNSSGDNIIIW